MMGNSGNILSQIRPCDTSRPYIFISYSNADKDTVWADVVRFQQAGYNIWLDERNLDKTKSSWKDDALRAISGRRCQQLLFYVSASSLTSENCLAELRETRSERAVTNHLDPVPFIAIDVVEVGNIVHFCREAHRRLQETIEDDAEFEKRAKALRDFQNDFFNGNNDRVRIHPRNEPGRKGDYYEDVQNSFPDAARISAPESRPVPPPEPPAPDPDDGDASQPSGPEASAADLRVVKTLNSTDLKYGICTFGSGMHVGFGVPVTLVMDGSRYERRMHSSGKGRVDGTKQLYADHGLKAGDVLDARYAAAEHTIYLTKIGGPQ